MNKLDFANKIGQLFGRIPLDKLLHFTVGLMVASAVAILCPSMATWCILPVAGVAVAKEAFDEWCYDGFDFLDFTATLLGGLFIQILAMI